MSSEHEALDRLLEHKKVTAKLKREAALIVAQGCGCSHCKKKNNRSTGIFKLLFNSIATVLA